MPSRNPSLHNSGKGLRQPQPCAATTRQPPGSWISALAAYEISDGRLFPVLFFHFHLHFGHWFGHGKGHFGFSLQFLLPCEEIHVIQGFGFLFSSVSVWVGRTLFALPGGKKAASELCAWAPTFGDRLMPSLSPLSEWPRVPSINTTQLLIWSVPITNNFYWMIIYLPLALNGSGHSPGGGHGNPLQVFLPGESHGQRSLEGYSPGAQKESDMTEAI